MIVEFEVTLAVAKRIKDGSPVFINGKEYLLTYVQKMLDEGIIEYVELPAETPIVDSLVESIETSEEIE